jgi:ADP-ribose pyrophosphatase YjhB (NUDIX family)
MHLKAKYRMKATPIAIGIVEHAGRIPLIRFARNVFRGFWGLPGGKFKDGEFLEQALEREPLEELGCTVRFGRCIGVVDEDIEDELGVQRLVMYICTAEVLQPPDLEPIDRAEGRVEWFTPTALVERKEQILESDQCFMHEIYRSRNFGYHKCKIRVVAGVPRLTMFASG